MEHKLDTLLAPLSDPVFLADLGGLVLWRNATAGRIAGPKRTLGELFGAETAGNLLRTDQMSTLEATMTLHDGSSVAQTLLVTTLGTGDPDQEVFLVIGKAVASVERSLHEREELLSSVAHDLKNPLGAIFGYSDALLDTSMAEGLSEGQREILARIRSTASRSIDLVRNYQQLSQLVTNKYRDRGPILDLNAVVRSVVENTWREDSKVPSVVLSLTPRALFVRAERLHLERLVSNLFTNALKFSDSDDSIRLRTALVNRGAGDEVEFSVNNHGPVIEEHEIPRLFERYARANATAHIAGTGLGLYIVRLILDAIGGSVGVTSSREHGTTFTVWIPVSTS